MIPDTIPPDDLVELALKHSDQLSAMLGYWDRNLICRFANKAYVDWFGVSKEDLIGKAHISELLGPLFQKNLPYINAVLSGEPQLFEREIPIPGSKLVKHSLASYTPDIKNGETIGFFVHVVDVTYIKELEKKLVDAKRETLRKIIETEESEKRKLVDMLGENVNQRLVACKIMLEGEEMKGQNGPTHQQIRFLISEIIKDINMLCGELTPTEIVMLGLIESIQHYLNKLPGEQQKRITLVCEDNSIEQIGTEDKFAIFRIIQNLIKIATANGATDAVRIIVTCDHPCIQIKLGASGLFPVDKTCKEYNAIACRVDYYGGNMVEVIEGTRHIISIKFDC